MVLVFCELCFGWTLRVATRCAECGHAMNLSLPDLDSKEIESFIGTFEKHIGRAIIDRKVLPKIGSLIQTNQGILFLPELEKQGITFVASKAPKQHWFRPVAKIWDSIRSPLATDTIANHPNPALQESAVANAVLESKEEGMGVSLAEHLLTLPGAFFVQNERIVRFQKKYQYWTLERLYGRSIQMKIDEE